jgi:cobalt-zinc-cadmium efflux system membrane fusion protein
MRIASSRGVWNELDGLLRFGVAGDLSDEELLGRFVARRDDAAEAAFAALVERYGPMVLGVCRRVLGDRHEAEDAFQATFLVLARKAAAIAQPGQLANWLYGVAARTALDARARATRRRSREQRVHAMSRSQIKSAALDQPVLDELRSILDEELARLPERFRGALVLCELDGLSRRAAAKRLSIPEGTLSSRLARAKALLRGRLGRRGLAVSAVALDAALPRGAQARALVVPLSLADSTIRAAARVAAGASIAEAGSTSVTVLAQGALKAMLLAKFKGFVLGVAAATALSTGVGLLAQSHSGGNGREGRQARPGSTVVAQRPSMGTMERLVLPGSTALDPAHAARVRARFTPVRVDEVARIWDLPANGSPPVPRELAPGDRVKKGDVLAVFYSTDVASKKNDLLHSLVQLELDQKILDRIQNNRDAIPEILQLTQTRTVQGDRNEVERALNALRAWDIPQDEIDVIFKESKKISTDENAWTKTPEGRWVRRETQAPGAKAELPKEKDAQDSWTRVTVRAPLDGVIVERSVHNGEVVSDNTVNLFQIADMSRLLVTAQCPEEAVRTLSALRAKDRRLTVSVRTAGAEPAMEFHGTIEEIGYLIDPNQHTAVVKGYVDNQAGRLRAGQYITVTVSLPPPDDVVEIPAESLVDDGKQTFVFVQPDPAKYEFSMRRVQVIHRLDGRIQVRSSPIPKEEQLTADEAKSGLLPKEPLRLGERVLLWQASPSVETRLSTLERKLDQVLEALGSLRRSDK